MDPDVCRNCGHSGKHIDFRDFRCAITERDDAERDKIQADAALERARQLCESSLSLMKRQMQELEDANAAIEALSRALSAAEDRRERIRRDLGTHGDVCLTARSNLEAAEEMAISAAGRYFEAGRAVTALEDREQQRSPGGPVEEALAPADEEMGDGGEDDEARERDNRKWQRSNERFCKWLRRSEAQRQIMKSSWTKVRVAERLASEGVDDEELARRNRVQEWAAARRLTEQLPPEDEPTMETEFLESEPEPEPTETTEPTEESASFPEPSAPPLAPKPAPAPTQLPSPTKPATTRRAAALRTRAKTGREGAATAAQTMPPTPARGRALRTARRVESQTRSEPTRPTAAATTTTTTTTTTMRVKKNPKTTRAAAPAAPPAKVGATASSDGAGRPAARTRARTGKTPAPEASLTAAAGRPQRVTRRRSARSQPYPEPSAQPRWK
ncbi:UbiD family decarboxylase [Colletotrichum graminicola]|nr:UbiD family decarboxylase [Colletotrichum graminicola]